MSTEPFPCRNHCIDTTPFEAFHHGSWHGIDHIYIKDGHTTVQFNYGGYAAEERIDGDLLRMRSRKANSADCSHFLKPGVDVCVLSARQVETTSDQEQKRPLLSWRDAQIISIKKIPHEDRCVCLFSVVIYRNKFSTSKKRSTNDRWVEMVPFDNIAILQKLQKEPCEDGYHRWNSTKDCVSFGRSKLINDTFASEVAWLIVLSTLRGMSFDLKLVENNIVHCVLITDHGPNSSSNSQADGVSGLVCTDSDIVLRIICFRSCDENIRPKIETLVITAPKEESPQKTKEANHDTGNVSSDSDVEILYGYSSLRQSKRLKLLHEQRKSYQTPNYDDCFNEKTGSYRRRTGQKENSTSDSSGSCSFVDEKSTAASVRQKEKSDGEFTVHQKKNRSGEKGNTVLSSHNSNHIYSKFSGVKKRKRKLLNPTECKEMIEDCIGNIRNEIKNQSEPNSERRTHEETYMPEEPEDFNWTPANAQEEKEEHEDLWKEMEHCLTTLSFLEQKQAVSSESLNGSTCCSERDGEEACQHDYELNEEIGLICRFCKSVSTEIRYITPSFLQTDIGFKIKEKFGAEKFNWFRKYDLEFDPSQECIPPWEISLLEGCTNVWSLIPDIKLRLHPHQKKAFEFIWRNTTGSLNPEEMDKLSGNGGGCVISHSPGSGKTLLVISFIVSYLRLFPRSRPLILAPKSAVHTWRKEFQKWGVSIPVHFIYRDESYDEMLQYKFKMSSRRSRRPNRKMLQIMDSLEKFKKWHEQPSILIMNYSSFLSLSKVSEKLEYSTFMADILQKSPGLLILDEGHNPRSTRSKLRKLLMNVKTELRVLLSGTLFQNNFEEYFNTLSLARPRFIHEVMGELDPHMVKVLNSRKQKKMKKRFHEEKLARKLFVEKVGQNIESSETYDRKQGFEFLSRLTTKFIDVYEAKMTDVLPGLQVYTIWLTSTELQQELLMKLQSSLPHKRYPLEIELLVTVGSIHPSLITSVSCAGNFFNEQELENVTRQKGNFKCGSKAKFVVDLVHKSSIRGEKVLVFCHNISPLHYLMELFEAVFGWKKGEVLILQGDQELHVRAKIMDNFNNDTNGQIKVLLASTTACAEGVSLTAASRLVMLDSEWNYSKTRQAIARAFRPGQERMVYVYLLLASGTWEEEKYESNARKAWMAKMTLGGRYLEYSSSRKVEVIDDELLREIMDEDQENSFQMITTPD